MAFGTSDNVTVHGPSQPRKVVEKTTERKFNEDGNVTWERTTEVERWVYDSAPGWWQQPIVSYTTGGITGSSAT